MAYANLFNATLISGSTQAKLIDDDLRMLRASLIERFNEQLFADATADPLVPLARISGRKLAKRLIIPFNHFTTLGGGSTIISTDKVQTSGDANPLVAGFSLPNGVTIKGAGVYVNSTGTANLELYKVTGVSPFTKVPIAAWQVTTAGQQVSSNGTVLTDLTDNLASYYLSVDLVSTSGAALIIVYGGYVEYDAASHMTTI